MRALLFILFPFSLIYDGITRLRNALYDKGVFRVYPSKIPAIGVGNLRVGGTGKTPMVEYLIRHFQSKMNVATLSRGYGRKTSGFLKADSKTLAADIGDEPLQIFEKFGVRVPVFVSEDRVRGIDQILNQTPVPDLLILDDAYQHRAILPQFSILLTTWQEPFFKDFVLPTGRLRESRFGALRADVVVVTKSPLKKSIEEKALFKRHIQKYAGASVPVFFSSISYGKPVALAQDGLFEPTIILFSGLANAESLVAYCQENFQVLEVVDFPDHHEYTERDIEALKAKGSLYNRKNLVFLTTEKDGAKVKSLLPKGYLGEFPIFVLPIEAQIEPEEEQKLLQLIQQKVFGKGHSGE